MKPFFDVHDKGVSETELGIFTNTAFLFNRLASYCVIIITCHHVTEMQEEFQVVLKLCELVFSCSSRV